MSCHLITHDMIAAAEINFINLEAPLAKKIGCLADRRGRGWTL